MTGIAHRDVDGAVLVSVLVSAQNPRLLVTQAGGTGPAQALMGTFGTMAARSGRQFVVADVVPPSPGTN